LAAYFKFEVELTEVSVCGFIVLPPPAAMKLLVNPVTRRA